MDDIVPFAMKPVGVKVDPLPLISAHSAAGGVFASIQATGHGQAFGSRGLGDKGDDRFVVLQGFASPIRRDEGKEAVFDLVPLAGPRWKMAHRNGKPGVIRELPQLDLPQPQPPAIAAAGVRRDQDGAGRWIEPFPFMTPPAPDRGHGKRTGVVMGPDIDKAGVAPDIINAVRIGARHLRPREVVPAHRPRLFRGTPLLARVDVVANEFFLLRTIEVLR